MTTNPEILGTVSIIKFWSCCVFCLLLYFCSEAFFIFCIVGIFFIALWYWAHLATLSVSIIPSAFLFQNFHRICYHSCMDSKSLQPFQREFDLCVWLQSCCYLVINTYCVYLKTQMYPEILYTTNFLTIMNFCYHCYTVQCSCPLCGLLCAWYACDVYCII